MPAHPAGALVSCRRRCPEGCLSWFCPASNSGRTSRPAQGTMRGDEHGQRHVAGKLSRRHGQRHTRSGHVTPREARRSRQTSHGAGHWRKLRTRLTATITGTASVGHAHPPVLRRTLRGPGDDAALVVRSFREASSSAQWRIVAGRSAVIIPQPFFRPAETPVLNPPPHSMQEVGPHLGAHCGEIRPRRWPTDSTDRGRFSPHVNR